jgi:hypothetical protein
VQPANPREPDQSNVLPLADDRLCIGIESNDDFGAATAEELPDACAELSGTLGFFLE